MRISDWSSDVCSSDLCERRFRQRVETILEDVEIQAAEIGDAIIVQLVVDEMKLAATVGRLQFFLQGGGLRDRPGIDCDQLVRGDPIRRRIELIEAAEQIETGRASCREGGCLNG